MRMPWFLSAAALCLLLAGCGLPQAQPASTPPPSASTPSLPSTSPTPLASASVAPAASTAPAVSAAAAVSPTPLPPLPKELLIPRIKVAAPVELVGTDPDGAMSAPAEWNDVGWYKGGYRPGQPGNAVIAGHLDSTTNRAVFWNLKELKPGDKVVVKDEDGSQLTFTVTGSDTYQFDRAPLQRIFGPSDVPMLNLVTCDGVFDRGSKNYSERLVVYTQLAGS